MQNQPAKPISITGMACRFPEAESLAVLCQLAFCESKQIPKETSVAATLQTHEYSPETLICAVLQEALSDAELDANSLREASLLFYNDAPHRKLSGPELKSFIEKTLQTEIKEMLFLTSEETSSLFDLIEASKRLASTGFPVVLMSIGSKNYSHEKSDGLSALVFGHTEEQTAKVYATLEESGNYNNAVAPLSLGLVVSSEATASKESTDALEKIFRSAREESGGSIQLPWSAFHTNENLLADYGMSTALSAIIVSALSLYFRIFPAAGDSNIQERQDSCFYKSPLARPWIQPTDPLKPARKAAVYSKSGLIHLAESVMEPELSLLANWSSELFILQADSPDALLQKLETFRRVILSRQEASLFELAFSLNAHLSTNNEHCRLAIIAHTKKELQEKLSQAIGQILALPHHAHSESPALSSGIYYSHECRSEPEKLAFILPGLGAAYPDMLLDLCFQFPEIRQVFDFGDNLAVKCNSDSLPSRKIFPVKSHNPWGVSSQSSLAAMDSAVATVLLSEWSLYLLLQNFGIRPQALMGCSTGEFAALIMNNSINIMDAKEMFYTISTAVSRSVPPEQLINLRSLRIKTARAFIESLLDKLALPSYLGAELTANDVIVSGSRESIDQLSKLLRTEKIEFYPLPSSIPYHTPLVSGKVSNKQDEVAKLPIRSPAIESWSCSTGTKYPEDPELIRKISTDLFEKPILFRSTLESMYENGARIFLEVGPKGGLVPLISEVFQSKDHLALACNQLGKSGIEQIQHVLSVLFCNGFQVNFDYLYRRRKGRTLSFEITEAAVPKQISQDDSYAVVSNYLKSMSTLYQSVMKTQENLLLSYLADNTSAERDSQPSALPNTALPDLWLKFMERPLEERLTKQLSSNDENKHSITLIETGELPQNEASISLCVEHVLSPEEKQIWSSFSTDNKRRIDWLLGRIAAKDAVRTLITAEFGLKLRPCDIEILGGESGQPEVSLRSKQDLEWNPRVAISHSAGIAVAVASAEKASPGIDIEEIKTRESGFAELAFTRKELTYLEQWRGKERDFRETVLWTAKEAVGKALGIGLRGNPKQFELDEIDLDAGRLFIKLCDQKENDRFLVRTEQVGNMALALTLKKRG